MERIPILRMGNFLLITIQVDMHDKLAMQLQDDVTARIADWGSIGVLIDISSLEIVDSFIGRMLANMAAMSRVLGAETVVRLPLDRHGSDEVSRLVERTIRPETLLFMPALDEMVMT